MHQTAPNPYDRVRYAGHVLAQAHPNRLATIAMLLGMKPADVARCRVLEVGCGDGMNLIAVALGLPGASCVGIDLAASAIDEGRQVIQELDLKNIALHQRNMMEVDRGMGEFDFIIAHGVYSWVPSDVRDKLLGICKENLAENGVAYVSYNTYPGGHLREMAREMMRYHVSEFREPEQSVAQARALIGFLAAEARSSGRNPSGSRHLRTARFFMMTWLNTTRRSISISSSSRRHGTACSTSPRRTSSQRKVVSFQRRWSMS
jgi:cyclopropane fatty-acyl-phospholipid synthase-like methyltransferase